ncbi:MAG: galactose-1-phosphate uridylyltransferase [bacterium]|nr:galactose-1-phosphate uridylyltransferase [bacterium]
MAYERLKSELRQDSVSGEWVLIAAARGGRPRIKQTTIKKGEPKRDCPFENPQAAGNSDPLVWFTKPNNKKNDQKSLNDWFIQVIPNKYPAVFDHKAKCPQMISKYMMSSIEGRGLHEVVITRDHNRSIGQMSQGEIRLIIKAYLARYNVMSGDDCTHYIHIFHNHKREAGASIAHPHSQIISLPIVPPDIHHSIEGSRRYFKKHHSCIHCAMISWERSQKIRVIAENKDFVAMAPYASKVSFEARIYPKKHSAYFEKISDVSQYSLAEIMSWVFGALFKKLNDPAYNFFIHTAPVADDHSKHYHWHMEILPATAHLAGLELGTGIDVVTVPPEEAALILKKKI